ncbi:class I SAM-dependent methyltransferase [Pullulanibacillus sp. KACC 23026]|uniref:class I SAM-dependent methyltransferase n=1 Tax=Pullulanibacillus sp. KACC 23026 TaxID=3028315 RepID=UPI0023B006F6|nr:class I SAM-dependent methyltransferase [Pullulanibacillus sp. KACC 23026]WEG14702.1 class I SAM-dependent methyltransferase [Pullulanibacillus sp. KACC 23026]
MYQKSDSSYKIHLEKEQETLLITLYAKALDNRQKRSILNDDKAEEMMQKIVYPFEKLGNMGNDLMVIRAKQMDTWTNDFLKNHSSAIVLNLGCGLDTRVTRINPQSRILWYDVDYPEVIDVRKLFYSNDDEYTMIASSIMESYWLESIPNDKPVLIIAEGVLEYLTESDVTLLFSRLTHHFSSGQIIFDCMNAFAVRSGKDDLKESTGAEHKWTVDKIKDIDQLNEKMTRVNAISLFDSKYVRKLPFKKRTIYRMMSLFPSFKNMIRLLSYKF